MRNAYSLRETFLGLKICWTVYGIITSVNDDRRDVMRHLLDIKMLRCVIMLLAYCLAELITNVIQANDCRVP